MAGEQSGIDPRYVKAGAAAVLGTALIGGVRYSLNSALESLIPWFKEKEFDNDIFNAVGWLAEAVLAFAIARYLFATRK